jgi:hypothetical protein
MSAALGAPAGGGGGAAPDASAEAGGQEVVVSGGDGRAAAPGGDGHAAAERMSVQAARERYAALAPAAIADGPCTVEGQVCHQRKLSKRLLFVDLRQVGSSAAVYAGQPKLEVMVKEAEVGAEQMLELRRTIKLGDEVRVQGRVERCDRQGDLVLLATAVSFARKWAQISPGCSFTPDPITAAGSKPSKRQRVDSGASQAAAAPAFLGGGDSTGGVEVSVAAGLCKFFVNQGVCKRDRCPYRHVAADTLAETRSAWVAERKASRLDAARLDGDPHENESKQDKAARASLFADFLLAEYGEERLRSGAGVVDVAGGKGELAFELHCRRGIQTTLIEPRPQKLTKAQRKYFKAQRRKQPQQPQGGGANLVGSGSGSGITDAAAMGRARAQAEAAQMPRQFRCFFCPHLLSDDDSRNGSNAAAAATATAQQDSTAVVTAAELPVMSVEEKSQLRSLLQQCSVVVGMHPDEATEPLVDFAIGLNKPWAVVPCCVFAHAFPGRTLRPTIQKNEQDERSSPGRSGGDGGDGGDGDGGSGDDDGGGEGQQNEGQPVQSYEDFVRYLQQKSSEARTVFLPFHGKNQVVYEYVPHPPATATADTAAGASAGAGAAAAVGAAAGAATSTADAGGTAMDAEASAQ